MPLTPVTIMQDGNALHNMENKMERISFQMLWDLMHQYGVFHGLLAGVTALIRGAYESEGLAKALLDAMLCCVIGVFAFQVAGTFDTFQSNVTMQLILAMVIGVVGANLIITSVRDCFTSALKQLNPLTWFKKAK